MNKKFHMTPAKLTAALFAVILLTVPIVTIALPKQERSENENRTRAKFPDIVNHTKMDKAENLGDVLGAIRWDHHGPKGAEVNSTYRAPHGVSLGGHALHGPGTLALSFHRTEA